MSSKSKTPRHHRLFYGSSYDRGLEHLLKMWPEIKKAYPDAELHICYGWELYDKAYPDNPERIAWKHRMNDDMDYPGIKHHGRVGKRQLRKIQKKCGIWAYPTHFGETCCITGMDCQFVGCVPVVIDLAGLKETVQSGIKVEGDIYDEETQAEYLRELLALMGDEPRWQKESEKAKKVAGAFGWWRVARHWVHQMGIKHDHVYDRFIWNPTEPLAIVRECYGCDTIFRSRIDELPQEEQDIVDQKKEEGKTKEGYHQVTWYPRGKKYGEI